MLLIQIIRREIVTNLDLMTNPAGRDDQPRPEEFTYRQGFLGSPHPPLVIDHWDLVIPAGLASSFANPAG